MSITNVHALRILDSRGNPTLEVTVTTSLGKFAAAVPSGASTGIHEALELRDGVKSEYMGKGVDKAINNVNEIIGKKLVEAKIECTEQEKIDRWMIELDGTPNKGKEIH